jgi:hypothetical protein
MSRTKSSDVKVQVSPLRGQFLLTAAENYLEKVKTASDENFGLLTRPMVVGELEELVRTIRSATVKATAKDTIPTA